MTPVHNLLSYLNPWNALKIPSIVASKVASLFSRTVCLPASELDDAYVWPDGVERFYAISSRAYPTVPFALANGVTVQIAQTWMTDLERIGHPDEFYINGKKIEKPPKTLREKQALVLELFALANESPDLLRRWTEIWS